jgi:transposase
MSIAAAAMARSINANLLRRWITEAESEADAIGQGTRRAAPPPTDAFIALPAPIRSQPNPPIQIEVRRGSLTVTMQWPTSALHECTVWLREVLK